MKISFICLLLSLAISSFSCTSTIMLNQNESIYKKILKKTDLPTGGKFLERPKNDMIQYYCVNDSEMWSDKENAQKFSGLYISEDNGYTWKLLCKYFQFRELFIHPETGKLFSIIDYNWLGPNKDGFIVPHHTMKALMSDDGKHWKDITGGEGYLVEITGIIADPDNPGRVCLNVHSIRGYIYQASDENYSKWIKYKEWDWPKRKELKKNSQ
jgi:hypothetical protein